MCVVKKKLDVGFIWWATGFLNHLSALFLQMPQQNLLTMEQIVSVEETQIKDKKCILLRIKGGKQFVLQCEVSPLLFVNY